ncbi:MAG: hypothetical protein V7632_5008 [Bradyrhizobium sp.]
MTIALTLLLASVLAGLAAGLYLRVWALMLLSPAVALLAAIVLQSNDFGFAGGVGLVLGCLVACQLAYLAGMVFAPQVESSMAEEIDGAPGRHSEQQIGGKKEQRQARP